MEEDRNNTLQPYLCNVCMRDESGVGVGSVGVRESVLGWGGGVKRVCCRGWGGEGGGGERV